MDTRNGSSLPSYESTSGTRKDPGTQGRGGVASHRWECLVVEVSPFRGVSDITYKVLGHFRGLERVPHSLAQSPTLRLVSGVSDELIHLVDGSLLIYNPVSPDSPGPKPIKG